MTPVYTDRYSAALEAFESIMFKGDVEARADYNAQMAYEYFQSAMENSGEKTSSPLTLIHDILFDATRHILKVNEIRSKCRKNRTRIIGICKVAGLPLPLLPKIKNNLKHSDLPIPKNFSVDEHMIFIQTFGTLANALKVYREIESSAKMDLSDAVELEFEVYSTLQQYVTLSKTRPYIIRAGSLKVYDEVG